MPQIPMTDDVAKLVGQFGERIENRSLLLEKYCFHKSWGMKDFRIHDANRWSLFRISEGGAQELFRQASRLREQANGRNVDPEKSEKLRQNAALCEKMGNTKVGLQQLAEVRAKHSRQFVSLFHRAFQQRSAIIIGQLEGRLAINLADGLIQNAGIELDRLFGLPCIPGSAIKGVSRHAALAILKNASEDILPQLLHSFRQTFGTADNDFQRDNDLATYKDLVPKKEWNYRGHVTFLPAYPLNQAKIVVDITNVHYPDYYRDGNPRNLAKEEPQLNYFPVVERGTVFAFCLVTDQRDFNSADHLNFARKCLEHALTINGIGAKTSSGYGWFSLQPGLLDSFLKEDEAERKRLLAAQQEEAARLAKEKIEKERLAKMGPEEKRMEELLVLDQQRFAEMAKVLSTQDLVTQKAFIRLLLENPAKKDTWKNWKKKKPETAKSIIETAKSLQTNMP